MTKDEFILKLTKSFGRNINSDTAEEIEEVKTWIIDKNISEDFLDILYTSIKKEYKYKKFPGSSFIIKQAGIVLIKKRERENRKYLQNGQKIWKIWRAEKFFKDVDSWEILELLKKIDKKNSTGIKLDAKEVDTRCTFRVMISDYYDMKEKEWSENNISNRLKFVRDSICEGRDVVALWEMNQRSDKSSSVVSNIIDSFNDKKNINNPDYFND